MENTEAAKVNLGERETRDEADLFLEGSDKTGSAAIHTLIRPLRAKSLQQILDELDKDPLSTHAQKVFILGYPSEVGHRNMDARVGASRGPDTFREILATAELPSDPVD